MSDKTPSSDRLVPPALPRAERSRIMAVLRKETVGGLLLVGAAVIAVIWANSPWADAYFSLRDYRVGYAPWHLDLTLGQWTSDGLLAIFFFLVGLELKREFVAGDLRNPSTAVVPMLAAAGGVAAPALIYTLIASGNPGLHHGWAIPTATDIAFAVAVLAIIGSSLPSALRIFLLTLAVVDDLIAIVIIAIFYAGHISPVPLLVSFVVIGIYWFVAHRYRRFFGLRPFGAWVVLFPIGVIAWGFMHMSGIHATIAGVLLGLSVPVRQTPDSPLGIRSGKHGLATEFEHRFRPLSAGVAVPLFALFAAGVPLGGWSGFEDSVTSTVAIAIVVALVVGKPVGIVLTTWVTTHVTRAKLAHGVRWVDMIGVGVLAGIGFTVSLLVTELSFPEGSVERDFAKVGVLLASVLAAALASLILIPRNRAYKKMRADKETAGPTEQR